MEVKLKTKLEAEFESAINEGRTGPFIVSAFEEKDIDRINFFASKGVKIDNKIGNKYKFLLLDHFSELSPTLKENIKSVLYNGQSEYKIEDIKTFKFKDEYGEHNGINQVRTDTTFTYDENTNSISRVDRAYSKPEGILLYEKKYLSNGIHITYFKKDKNEKLIEGEICNNEITFDLNSIGGDCSPSEFKEKVKETISSKNIDMFDDDLSNPFYAYILLQEYYLYRKSSYSINLACGKELQDEKNVENIETIINDSTKEENKNKIFICNFAYSNHQVQFLICNGKVISINTSEPDPLYGVKWDIIDELKEKNIDVVELYNIEQNGNSCVVSSKMYTVNLITNLLNVYENPVELFDKISIVGKILNKTEIEQKEYIERLNNNECNELFKILMIIYETDYDLLNKESLGEKITKQTLEMRRQVYKQKQLDFFSEESDKIINFRDVFISAKYKIPLLPEEEEFIESTINDFRQSNPSLKNFTEDNYFTEDNFLEFVKFFNPSNKYYYKLQDFIKIREENKQQNNDEKTDDWEKFSMKCLLIAIKMGNFSSINLYFDELASYVKKQKNLNEEEKSELLRTELKSAVDYFNTEDNNIYVSAITNIFEKEREKLNQTNQITGDNNNSHKEMMPNTESELGKNKTKILELSESIDSFSDKENEIKTQILRKSIDNFSNEQSEQQEENNDIQEKCGCCLIS